MNKLVFLMVAAVLTGVAYGDENSKDPNPYADYGRAMAHEDGCLMAVEWQNEQGAKLAGAIDENSLAACVANEEAATALLARVKDAYETDPMVATQIAAVSQWVMVDDDIGWYDFWSDTPRANGRKIWVKALVSRAESANDVYVQLFCLDQLRWCGCKCPCVIRRIEAIGDKSADLHVKEMVSVVLRSLK